MIALLKLFRFPLVFTAIADSAAGYAFLGRWSVAPLSLGLLAVASSGLYFFGMALNDIADRERDRALAPSRVLPSGRLSLQRAMSAAVGVLGLSLASVLLLPGRLLDFGGIRLGFWPPLAIWAGVGVGILAYDCFLKIPPVMGSIRALNFLLGVMAAAGSPTQAGLRALGGAWLMALTPFIYVTALTFVSTFEEGGGRRPLVIGGALLMSAAAFFPEILSGRVGGEGPNPGAWIVSALLGGLVLLRAYRAEDRRGIMLLVRDSVGGIILLDAIILLSSGRSREGWILLGLVVPAALSVAVFKRLA